MNQQTKWVQTNGAVPRVTVQMIPVDIGFRIMAMHRSNNVRSARNVWSFPSGLHEVGQSLFDGAARELGEEYGLEALDYCHLGVYENWGGDPDAEEQWHWVIVLLGVMVSDVTKAVNKEPDKHDQMIFEKVGRIADPQFLIDHQFHPSFHTYLGAHAPRINQELTQLVLTSSYFSR